MKYDVSGTEREIMEVLWEKGQKLATKELMDIFNERGRQWKRQTLNTFLMRLEEKELIHRESGTVEASFSKQEYQSRCCQEILAKNFDGKISNFLCAFYDGRGISQADAEELLTLINQKKKG